MSAGEATAENSAEMVPARECGHLVPRPRRGPVPARCADCKRQQTRERVRAHRIRKGVRWVRVVESRPRLEEAEYFVTPGADLDDDVPAYGSGFHVYGNAEEAVQRLGDLREWGAKHVSLSPGRWFGARCTGDPHRCPACWVAQLPAGIGSVITAPMQDYHPTLDRRPPVPDRGLPVGCEDPDWLVRALNEAPDVMNPLLSEDEFVERVLRNMSARPFRCSCDCDTADVVTLARRACAL